MAIYNHKNCGAAYGADPLNIFGSGFAPEFVSYSSLQQQNQALAVENAILKADASTDKKLVEVYTALRNVDKAQDEKTAALSSRVLALETAAPLREQILMGQVQSVANSVSDLASSTSTQIANVQAQGAAAVASSTAGLQYQINCLQNTLHGIVKTVVPNDKVCPGWGGVTVTPATT